MKQRIERFEVRGPRNLIRPVVVERPGDESPSEFLEATDCRFPAVKLAFLEYNARFEKQGHVPGGGIRIR